ncbi:MAG: DUF433 domain-containing protein [Luteitalea sp.]|nr:DUF433 domain-containing protein [Luteitalea sp.]
MRLPLTQTTPLVQEPDGSVRVRGSRVTLDTLVELFRQGATAEQINDSLPSLSLRDIYGAVAYYLEHTVEVEAYLTARCERASVIRREIESHQDVTGLRERVRARRARQASL